MRQICTSEDRDALVVQFQRSGLNRVNFCKQNRLNYKTFSKWIYLFEDKKRCVKGKFAQVETIQDGVTNIKENRQEKVHCVFANGVEVMIPQSIVKTVMERVFCL